LSSQNLTSTVVTRDEGAVRIVVLNRPGRLNALNIHMQRALMHELEAAAEDEGVGAVILTGAGGNFSAGADLELMEEISRGGAQLMAFTDLSFPRAFMHFPKPMIAAIEGVAVGWGATVSLWCDMRVAGRGARFRFPFASVGLTPEFGSCFWLPRIVGLGRAMELMLTGRWVKAEQAWEMGLVNEVVAEGKALERAIEIGGNLASLPPHAIAATKAIMRLGVSAPHPEQVLDPEITLFRQALTGNEFKGKLAELLSKIGRQSPGDDS